MEACYGCGIRTRGEHPVVAAVHREDVDQGAQILTDASQRGFVMVPVCKECHESPEHRTTTIKGHFFMREDLNTAHSAAGTSGQVGASRV